MAVHNGAKLLYFIQNYSHDISCASFVETTGTVQQILRFKHSLKFYLVKSSSKVQFGLKKARRKHRLIILVININSYNFWIKPNSVIKLAGYVAISGVSIQRNARNVRNKRKNAGNKRNERNERKKLSTYNKRSWCSRHYGKWPLHCFSMER